VCCSVDDLEVLQCAHADCRRCVKIKHEEGRGDRDERVGRIGCKAVGDGTHGMLSHTVVDIPSAIISGNAACRLQFWLSIVSRLV
jgi:hypothetical protein